MRLPTLGLALPASILRPSRVLHETASIGDQCVPARSNHISGALPALVAGIQVFLAALAQAGVSGRHKPGDDSKGSLLNMTGIRDNIAQGANISQKAIAGLSAVVLMGTSVLAQSPRSVIILPDLPAAPAVAPAPDISAIRLELLNSTVKVENPAGVSVDLIPKLQVSAGSKIGFRIATKKTGYLILLDVDASGKLTQIFPSPTAATHGLREATNLVKPGRPLIIPQLGTPYAGIEFVADLPAGIAMVVALLSDKPVQVVDLPDTPPPAFAPGDTLRYVRDQTRTLKVPNPNGGPHEQPSWSIDGKFYLIK
jgi:hypothetical protein